jgi:hypothetical protein
VSIGLPVARSGSRIAGRCRSLGLREALIGSARAEVEACLMSILAVIGKTFGESVPDFYFYQMVTVAENVGTSTCRGNLDSRRSPGSFNRASQSGRKSLLSYCN